MALKKPEPLRNNKLIVLAGIAFALLVGLLTDRFESPDPAWGALSIIIGFLAARDSNTNGDSK
ncbi:MAG: hypothetical protein ACREA0_25750 [bacterium]